VVCYSCNEASCFGCGFAWHEGETCAQYEKRRNLDNRLSSETISKTTKPCPKCSRRITKVDGCFYVKCICSKEFCFECGADYTGHVHNGACSNIDPILLHPPPVRRRPLTFTQFMVRSMTRTLTEIVLPCWNLYITLWCFDKLCPGVGNAVLALLGVPRRMRFH
jgi:hypothetical protein